MKIAIVGTGYVGLVTGTCFAEMGNDVVCIDIDIKKITDLNAGIIPIYEPGLDKIIERNINQKRLHFTSSFEESIPNVDICFIAVGTPPLEDGSADVKYVLSAADSIGRNMKGYTIIVDKSTVPVGTAKKVEEVLKKYSNDFDVVSNPEFLKEGAAIEDFMKPDRVVIGSSSEKAKEIMKKLYEPFVSNGHPIILTDTVSAELIKYAANAMLATRISFMNEIAKLCDKVGGDVKAIREGIGTDSRIGMSFLYASCGYGGSCFPKDVNELIQVGKRNGLEMKIAHSTESVNYLQKHLISDRIFDRFGVNLTGKVFTIWGLAFKSETDDVRESPALYIIKDLIFNGATVKVYDPVAIETAKKYLSDVNDKIVYCDDMMESLTNAEALVVTTEWKQFKSIDLNKVKRFIPYPIIFDGKNIYDISEMKKLGFEYHCIGRGAV